MCSEMGEFMLDQNDQLQDVTIAFKHFIHEKLVKDQPSGMLSMSIYTKSVTKLTGFLSFMLDQNVQLQDVAINISFNHFIH